MRHMTYRGDRSDTYTSGRGVVGKVVGPGAGGQYFVITEATYDAESDTTHVTAMQLRRPEDRLDEIIEGNA